MQKGVVIDTGFLISLVDPNRPNHDVAESYYRHALDQGIVMYLPTLVMAEFAVKQQLSDLPRHFVPAPFNPGDAGLAGKLISEKLQREQESRDGAKVDLFVIAQAHRLGVATVLAEDRQTLRRNCDSFRERGIVSCHVVLLSEKFVAARLLNPTSHDLF